MGRHTGARGRTCTIEGCSRVHNARGLCHTHYIQAQRAGKLPPAAKKMSAWETLLSQSEWDGNCLRWTGYCNEGGYGRVNWGGTQHQAHRLAYEAKVGPIPTGMHVDHVLSRGCRFRDCFNPDHLEPVTPSENVRRQARHDTDKCPAGHKFVPRNDGTGWRTCVECRRERQAEKVTCECGAVVRRNHLRVHRTRQTHIRALGIETTEELT